MAPDSEPRPDGEVVWAEDAGGPLLRFRGAIDRETVRRFRLRVPPASWPPRADLAEVSALDAAGVELHRSPRRQGWWT